MGHVAYDCWLRNGANSKELYMPPCVVCASVYHHIAHTTHNTLTKSKYPDFANSLQTVKQAKTIPDADTRTANIEVTKATMPARGDGFRVHASNATPDSVAWKYRGKWLIVQI